MFLLVLSVRLCRAETFMDQLRRHVSGQTDCHPPFLPYLSVYVSACFQTTSVSRLLSHSLVQCVTVQVMTLKTKWSNWQQSLKVTVVTLFVVQPDFDCFIFCRCIKSGPFKVNFKDVFDSVPDSVSALTERLNNSERQLGELQRSSSGDQTATSTVLSV